MSRVVDLWHTKDPDTGKKVKTDRYGKGSRWQVVWTGGRGKDVKKSHRTKDAANAWLSEQDEKRRNGLLTTGGRVLISELREEWFDSQIQWSEKIRTKTTRLGITTSSQNSGTPFWKTLQGVNCDPGSLTSASNGHQAP